MTIATFEDIQRDTLALGVARAVAVANEALAKKGVDLGEFFVQIHENDSPRHRVWTVHYIPRDYVQCRGGGWEVTVSARTGKVKSILRGQ